MRMEKEMSKNISNNNETPKDMYPEKLNLGSAKICLYLSVTCSMVSPSK